MTISYTTPAEIEKRGLTIAETIFPLRAVVVTATFPVKQQVQAGQVQIRKVVEERQENVPVTLGHEEVTIERRPLTDASQLQNAEFAEQTINVPVYAEQAELQRQVTGEEVVVHKQAVQEQQTISGTTRHEHVEVDQTGNVQVQGNVETTQNTHTTQGHTHNTDTNRGNH